MVFFNDEDDVIDFLYADGRVLLGSRGWDRCEGKKDDAECEVNTGNCMRPLLEENCRELKQWCFEGGGSQDRDSVVSDSRPSMDQLTGRGPLVTGKLSMSTEA